MDAPPSPNHVFNFPEEEFEEDPQEEPEEEFEEDPKEDPEKELEAEAEEDAPPVVTPPIGSPITPQPLSESLSDIKAAALEVANGPLEIPPAGRTFEVGGPSLVSLFPLFYLHEREIMRLDNNNESLFSNVKYLERCYEVQFMGGVEGRMTKLEDNDQEKTEGMEKIKKRLETLETNYVLVLSERDEWKKAFYNLQAWVSERLGWGAMDARPYDGVDGSAAFRETIPPRRLRGAAAPRRSRRAAMERLIADRVAEAIAEHEKNRPNPDNEGVVGLRRWIEKVEQVFGISKCAEQDKVRFVVSTLEGRALTWWNGNVHTLGLVNANSIPWDEFKSMLSDDIETYNNRFHELALMCPELVPTERKKIKKYIRGFLERIKGTITSSKTTTLHEAVNMARELVEQAVQGITPLQDVVCYGCGDKGHYRNQCPKGRNQPNDGAHTSFEVELADGKVVSTNTVLRGCTLALYNHCFKIGLLLTRLKSFDVIVGMDWLSYHHGVIVCYEKIVHIPLSNGEILQIQGKRPEKDPKLLSCIKADEKKLDDICIVHDFLKSFHMT
ncbi:putative reverse transcriptase domain-containing protein [Tanacetum coccineum]|uniref:Reverse transcriptase domain-containing protein n=1 Tax=Tanacetum coccineum TaxID=301880 RepID=A0ABQ5IVW9_9ASTR